MKKPVELPFMNVRDIVLFPEAYQQLYIGRTFTIEAIKSALKSKTKAHRGKIIVITQKAVQKEKPLSKADMFSVGTICQIENSVMLSDGTMKVLLRGEQVLLIKSITDHDGVRLARGTPFATRSLKQKLPDSEKREVLGLLLRWNPEIAIDDDEERFDLLKKETKLSDFISTISGLISFLRPEEKKNVAALKKRHIGVGSLAYASCKKLKTVNGRIKKRQLLLEEVSQSKQLRLIKEILNEEIHSRF